MPGIALAPRCAMALARRKFRSRPERRLKRWSRSRRPAPCSTSATCPATRRTAWWAHSTFADSGRLGSTSHQGNLRICARSERLPGVLEQIVSNEAERQRFAAVGRALADPKRLCVLESLAAGELSVSDLSVRVACRVPNMSQHLAVLRSAGLVSTRRDGNTVFYRLADERVLEAYRLIQTIAR